MKSAVKQYEIIALTVSFLYTELITHLVIHSFTAPVCPFNKSFQ